MQAVSEQRRAILAVFDFRTEAIETSEHAVRSTKDGLEVLYENEWFPLGWFNDGPEAVIILEPNEVCDEDIMAEVEENLWLRLAGYGVI